MFWSVRKSIFTNLSFQDVVLWPEDLSAQPLTPRDVFGNKLERLDTLRMQDKVWIILQQPTRDDHWRFEIWGYDGIEVEAAKEHLGTLIEAVRRDTSGTQDALNIIVDAEEGIIVKLQQHEDWWPNAADKVVPRLLSHQLMRRPGTFRQEGLSFTQMSNLQESIKLALDNVRHKKGMYDFVVRLGSLVLKTSKHVGADSIGQMYAKEVFQKQIKNGPVELDVKKW